jgi:hypothetical protein
MDFPKVGTPDMYYGSLKQLPVKFFGSGKIYVWGNIEERYFIAPTLSKF